jgi:hypothetical protein
MFPSLFSGTLDCLKDVRVQLHLDPEVKPVRQKLRPLPFHLREAVSKEIKKQIELGILERVTDDMGPTPWVSNIVPVLKDKEVKLGRDGKPSPVRPQAETTPEVRITIDNRAQNKAIRRTHYPTKTVEELLYEANGSKVFSKLDHKGVPPVHARRDPTTAHGHHDTRGSTTLHEAPYGHLVRFGGVLGAHSTGP